MLPSPAAAQPASPAKRELDDINEDIHDLENVLQRFGLPCETPSEIASTAREVRQESFGEVCKEELNHQLLKEEAEEEGPLTWRAKLLKEEVDRQKEKEKQLHHQIEKYDANIQKVREDLLIHMTGLNRIHMDRLKVTIPKKLSNDHIAQETETAYTKILESSRKSCSYYMEILESAGIEHRGPDRCA